METEKQPLLSGKSDHDDHDHADDDHDDDDDNHADDDHDGHDSEEVEEKTRVTTTMWFKMIRQQQRPLTSESNPGGYNDAENMLSCDDCIAFLFQWLNICTYIYPYLQSRFLRKEKMDV